ncbi:MAG: hypothetical protein K9L86_07045 [Candidatus Omnitrophica bacterium]|nr:hypothetical protein [Candidatus Omnitrophota bacterium]
MVKKTKCPVCKENVEIEEGLGIADILNCQGCFAELKLTKLNPVELEEEIGTWDDYVDYSEEEEDFNGKGEREEWS